ncbi:helix-turn-helix domain-containing protein (plasmid) [Pseudomonas mandelii]|uniref:helix-turn-helix domain-containing protein n=1 Tax=Pseudomonas mandelii TaxID=75612 RepID=UPI0009F716DA|nr:helix-turn-helix transcriptional regulator [Pseudomonas mandelii]TWS06270.1 helix-turn-helix transcriptional regulator [Pseudomonas mandelii]
MLAKTSTRPWSTQSVATACKWVGKSFSDVSSRTYLSTLERGQKCPTLEKVVELASVLQVHPLTLIAESFLVLEPGQTLEALLDVVQCEARPV